MDEDGAVAFWNNLMRLLRNYNSVLDDNALSDEALDELRSRIVEIDDELDKIKEKYRVLT